jgi:hypothetical protein
LLNILLSHLLCLSAAWFGMVTSDFARRALIGTLRRVRYSLRKGSQ